jgi:hypothetical protein
MQKCPILWGVDPYNGRLFLVLPSCSTIAAMMVNYNWNYGTGA